MITPSDYNGNQAGFNPVIGKESCGKMVRCLGSIYHPTLMILPSPVADWCGNRFTWVRRWEFGQFALASHPAETFHPSPKNYIHAGKPVRMHLPNDELRIVDLASAWGQPRTIFLSPIAFTGAIHKRMSSCISPRRL